MKQIGEIMEDIRDMPVCPESGEINLYCIIQKHIKDGIFSFTIYIARNQRCFVCVFCYSFSTLSLYLILVCLHFLSFLVGCSFIFIQLAMHNNTWGKLKRTNSLHTLLIYPPLSPIIYGEWKNERRDALCQCR